MNSLGFDISKDKFDVALLVNKKGKHKVFKNNQNGFERFEKWLKENSVESVHCCMESTGRYGEELAKYLIGGGHKVSIVNPACIKSFAHSQLKRVKTDKVDALLIAKYCEMNNLDRWEAPSDQIEELIELSRKISHLEKLKTSENNHLKSGIRSQSAIESTKKMICSLKEEIKSLKKQASKITDLDDELKKNKDLLKTIPGISKIQSNNQSIL
ncbi:MAG: transposase [Candidatus Caenarcaniphilales bacterium]|nr:transposase [Candidatus Caenarcaniphilales bacterium]